MKNVLVTAVGSFSAEAVIASLKNRGLRVIGCDIYPFEWLANAASVDAFYQVPKASDAERYLAAIRGICNNWDIDMIIPLTDEELSAYALARDSLGKDVAVGMSSPETILMCEDKRLLEEFIRSNVAGIQTIPSLTPEQAVSLAQNGELIAKPRRGRSSEGFREFQSQDDFEFFVRNNRIDEYVFQRRIAGDVVTVDVVRAGDGARCVAIPRRELLRTSRGAGVSVLVFRDEKLEELCMQLAGRLGIVGCVNFEFIQDAAGDYHFLECNPRFSGGVKFSCMAGYDCVANHLRCFTGEPIEDYSFCGTMYIARRYEEHVMAVAKSWTEGTVRTEGTVPTVLRIEEHVMAVGNSEARSCMPI